MTPLTVSITTADLPSPPNDKTIERHNGYDAAVLDLTAAHKPAAPSLISFTRELYRIRQTYALIVDYIRLSEPAAVTYDLQTLPSTAAFNYVSAGASETKPASLTANPAKSHNVAIIIPLLRHCERSEAIHN